MSKVSKRILIVLWLTVFPVAFTATWLRTPSLWFINLPDLAWNFLADTFDLTCCEGTADLEVFVGLTIGFVLAICILLLAWMFRAWERGK